MIFPHSPRSILIRFVDYTTFYLPLHPTHIRPRSGYFCFRGCAKEFECTETIRCYQSMYLKIYIYIHLPLSSKSTVTLTVDLRAMEQGTFVQPSMFR